MITQVIWTDVNNRELDTIYARMGDDEIREVQFIICRNDPPEKVEVPAGVSGQFRMIKSSGNFVVRDMTKTVLENGTVIFTVAISDQMVNVQGTGYYDIRLSGGGYLYTASGKFIVDSAVISSGVLEDVSEVNGRIFPDDFLTTEDHVAIIDDDSISTDSTWSSDKISNEIEAHAGSDVSKTVSGNPVIFTDGADSPLVKCVTEIQGSQDLHGYDKPWVGGAGKNKCPVDISYFNGNSGTWYSLAGVVASDFLNGTVITLSPGTYYIQLYDADGISNIQVFSSNGSVLVNEAYGGSFTISSTGDVYVRVKTDKTSITCKTMLAIGSTATSYEPYSNICPITAYTEGEIEVSDGDGNVTTHTTTFPSAIYRGSEDVVNGSFGYDMQMIDLVDLNWTKFGVRFYAQWALDSPNCPYAPSSDATYIANAVCDSYYVTSRSQIEQFDGAFSIHNAGSVYLTVNDSRYATAEDFKAGVTGVKLAYQLLTPTTSSVTPTNLPIKSLSGYNHIESSTGDMEVEYITGEFQPIVESSKHVYSTQEQIVGKWIDGRNVYEYVKSISLSIPASGSTTEVSLPEVPSGASILSVSAINNNVGWGSGGLNQCVPCFCMQWNGYPNVGIAQFSPWAFSCTHLIIQYIAN